MTCATSRGDVPQQYVAGTLADDDVHAFELHLLECAECRETVRAGAAARHVLLQPSVPSGWHVRRGAVVGMALAAGLAVFLLSRPDEVTRLAEVEPPAFVAAAIRGSGDSMIAAVDRGMAAYTRKDYQTAARELAASGDSSPGVAFYLGAALAASDQSSAAVTALQRAMRPAGNPYADEAMILAAKAWLRSGRADSALAALAAVGEESTMRQHARALADSIRRAVR